VVDGDRVARARRTTFHGVAYRQQAVRYDPRSGEGARQRGGRYNPPGSFPVLYLCTTRDCAVAEFRREGERQVVGVAGLLPRLLFRYEIVLDDVIDLTDSAVLVDLGVTTDELVQRDWKSTQDLGTLAHHLGCQALVAPSATGIDTVLVVFLENVALGTVEPTALERWESVDDL
jgi:RES domain-containing protein